MQSVIVIGAGIGGLVSAVDLARQGLQVTVLERAATPGGKMRQTVFGDARIDAGPTVFTMRRVFEEIFADAGANLADHLTLKPAEILARHAWDDTQHLDLFADINRSADAIGAFAGATEARGYRAFCARAKQIFATLENNFIRAPRPTAVSLAMAGGVANMFKLTPFSTMWQALGEHFKDPRLRQLFGRYATYNGSSPWLAPATLMLIAHVEQDGVWMVEGGMHQVALALARLAGSLGAEFRYNVDVKGITTQSGRATGVELANGERLSADAVVLNGDVASLGAGLFGAGVSNAAPRVAPKSRSLSAVTWTMAAQTQGFPLSRHNVFFSRDYQAEFDDIFTRSRLPREPTIYVCAQDRDDSGAFSGGAERLLILCNAPARGDLHPLTAAEITQCTEKSFAVMQRCGLSITRDPDRTCLTTPTAFNQLFPATGGALYGQAVHGAMSPFSRPDRRSKILGLYLAGGSTHPGAGVPMAAISGRLAAAAVMADRTSRSRSRITGMPGGTSTPSAMTAPTR